jgi:hypothetical protein
MAGGSKISGGLGLANDRPAIARHKTARPSSFV